MKTVPASFIALGGLFASLAQAHVAITYPGWRGNNIFSNETFPFGMQWIYPCGGLGVTSNRTHWPLDGGAIAVQPGFNSGHKSALMYINIGIGEEPASFTTVMVPMFHLTGPTNEAYDGTFCLPKVPIPAGLNPREGDKASIQVIQAAQHGGTLFSCADIIFTSDESKILPVDGSNCFNISSLRVEAASIEINSSPITDPSKPTVSIASPFHAARSVMAPIFCLLAVIILM
ncbi:uncharacterized protein CTRU02_212405 [Colletotrichum truncatum]|uniref:Uncharacterized protein n=1 Tax=Colletotrichum truncatum TaxID=5467 RepID=A0ACC3YNQ9_COLTU|nr:uncharacterized protein CTRU02_08723 [Colletotrichum truncatum]KAF6789476.1 hypothetical protein CTRU02_08723 [Colletotrichum truncatum]